MTPMPFQYRVCRACQDDGRRSFVPSFVPSAEPLVHSCGLFQQWGSRVCVGSSWESRRDGWVPGATLGFVDVWIDESGSLVGNPFVRGPPRRLAMAYDELLLLILTDDLDIDRTALNYHRLLDAQRPGLARVEPVERRILLEVAAKHDVLVSCDSAAQHSFAGFRAWIAFHVQLLQSGHSLRLLGPLPDPSCALWSTHGLSLVGALLWAGGRLLDGAVTVRRLPCASLSLMTLLSTLPTITVGPTCTTKRGW